MKRLLKISSSARNVGLQWLWTYISFWTYKYLAASCISNTFDKVCIRCRPSVKYILKK